MSRHALRRSTWRRLFRNVWILAQSPLDRATWLAAARLVLPVDAVLCGLSAAEEFGADVRPQDDVTVHAAFADRVPRQRCGMALRQLSLSPDEVIRRGGWLVTTALRTAFDCARWVTRVARVALLSDPRAESPMESRLRLLLVRAGLTGLQPQVNVFTAAGVLVGRLDLAFEAQRVAVEYDGAWHWKQRRADDRRRDAIRALGWTVIVVSAEDYYGDPHGVVDRVRRALDSAAA